MRYTEDDEVIMKRIDEITQSLKRDKQKDLDVVLTLFKNVETRNLFFGTSVTKRKVEIWRISVVVAGDPTNIYNDNIKKVPEMRIQQVTSLLYNHESITFLLLLARLKTI
jgi:hypothetical protein